MYPLTDMHDPDHTGSDDGDRGETGHGQSGTDRARGGGAEAPSLAGVANAAVDRLFELALVVGDLMERGLAERGLTLARAEVIWELHHRGPVTQRRLSQALRCSPRNVTGLLDGLEAGGFVAREPHPHDRRATLVSLTGEGAAFAATTRAEHEAFAEVLFGDRQPGEVAAFLAMLGHVIGRIEAAGDPPCP